MTGGVYCPLSSRDPQYRLYSLMQQTQSRLALVDYHTKSSFPKDIAVLEINTLLTNKHVERGIDVSRLEDVLITFENIAYIIFTSGSTGIPKPVSNQIKSVILSD